MPRQIDTGCNQGRNNPYSAEASRRALFGFVRDYRLEIAVFAVFVAWSVLSYWAAGVAA